MDFTERIDLAAERLGGAVLLANDEFFAPKENLIKAAAPVWREDEYTERGKWMDGWETRRRRSPGHDWCILRLGVPGRVRGVVVDTTHFTGNHPEAFSLDACAADAATDPERLAGDDAGWVEIVPRSPLRGDARNRCAVDAPDRFTHVRLRIHPDGGVARLRVHGDVLPDWQRLARPGVEPDLAALRHGGLVVACSDDFYGRPQNMLLPGPALGMHDGWETRRRRGPGHDWAVVRLGARGTVRRVVVDTSHFKGNAPGACSLHACDAGAGRALDPDGRRAPDPDADWSVLLPRTTLRPHTVHEFVDALRDVGPATHVRLDIFPDGGVARLRVHGTRAGGEG